MQFRKNHCLPPICKAVFITLLIVLAHSTCSELQKIWFISVSHATQAFFPHYGLYHGQLIWIPVRCLHKLDVLKAKSISIMNKVIRIGGMYIIPVRMCFAAAFRSFVLRYSLQLFTCCTIPSWFGTRQTTSGSPSRIGIIVWPSSSWFRVDATLHLCQMASCTRKICDLCFD